MLRRFFPLMVCVVLALLVLVARLYEVTVKEHSIWAREAASLERSAHLVPYERGDILDRQGRPWVRDQVSYEIEFVWRQFRRDHPLGNIAQLMSLTLMRPVDLREVAGGDAALWADHLASLSPKEIRQFGRGGALTVGGVQIPALPEDLSRSLRRQERRPARAEDLRFYIERLLQVDRREWRDLRDLRDSQRASEPYAQLVASLRQSEDESLQAATQRLRRELRQRVDRSLLHLQELGSLVDWQSLDAAQSPEGLVPLVAPGPEANLTRVVAVLDQAREESENLAADRLFRIAAGFSAGQISLDNLARLDLAWLQKCLYWDEARLHAWRTQRGGDYARQVGQYAAGYVFARMQLAEGDLGDRVLDALAHEFVYPEDRPDPRRNLVLPWSKLQRLRVLAALPRALAEEVPEGWWRAPVFPIQTEELLRTDAVGIDLIDAALAPMDAAFGGRQQREQIALALLHLPGETRRRTDWKPLELVPIETVLLAWQDALDQRLSQILDELPQPVEFDADAVRAALEDRDHIIKDMSSRPMRFTENPSQDMVLHVERYHEDYAGLIVKDVRTRRAEAVVEVPSQDPLAPEPELRVLAAEWIGKVRSPKLVSLLEKSAQERHARELWRQVELDEQDRKFVQETAAERHLPNQTVGGSGIEGHFDRELRGRNGFREVVGLQQTRGQQSRRPMYLPPVDGLDLELTLDLDLQRAAEDVINHPLPPPVEDDRPDLEWVEDPVGAIVLMTTDGAVLAAASAPYAADTPGPHQDGQRMNPIDRTLRMPMFQPPGSVLKPLVAAWALEYRGLNPSAGRVLCHPHTSTKKKDGAGWGEVACHKYGGHSASASGAPDIDLEVAIRVSCNTYFAQLGETRFDSREFQKLFDAFGIGERTGILDLGAGGRGGWLEEYEYRRLEEFSVVHRQRLANGLSHVDVTPMQMARAYAGLATGLLPKVRVVQRVGDRWIEPEVEALPIASHNLSTVQRAMAQVVQMPGGSAYRKGLSEEDLGFRFVCKTGSADYANGGWVPNWKTYNPRSGMEPEWVEGTRKHTWVCGWLPAENPKMVVVVYVHDTATTSSHSSVYVAAQILQHPAVQAYLREES